MQTKIVHLLPFLISGIFLSSCGPSEAEHNVALTASADAILATQTAQVPPSALVMPTLARPDCPTPTAGTLLLKDDDGSYCLLYPDGHGVVLPLPGEVCLVPGEPPYTLCHSASLIINVEGADGRTADQVADAVQTEAPCSEERYNLTLANENAVVLPECAGQATSRKVFIVHAERLYTLTFFDLSERFYAQIITSFFFLR
jgi:hypothetical protein